MESIDSIASRDAINETLSKIRSISQKTDVFKQNNVATVGTSQQPSFTTVLNGAKNALNEVNASQNLADSVRDSYLAGDPKTSISQVMVASAKSKIAFEGLIAVRNKFLDAYREIMNMPI